MCSLNWQVWGICDSSCLPSLEGQGGASEEPVKKEHHHMQLLELELFD